MRARETVVELSGSSRSTARPFRHHLPFLPRSARRPEGRTTRRSDWPRTAFGGKVPAQRTQALLRSRNLVLLPQERRARASATLTARKRQVSPGASGAKPANVGARDMAELWINRRSADGSAMRTSGFCRRRFGLRQAQWHPRQYRSPPVRNFRPIETIGHAVCLRC